VLALGRYVDEMDKMGGGHGEKMLLRKSTKKNLSMRRKSTSSKPASTTGGVGYEVTVGEVREKCGSFDTRFEEKAERADEVRNISNAVKKSFSNSVKKAKILSEYGAKGFEYKLVVEPGGDHVGIRPFPDTSKGVFVLEVLPNTLASRSGVQAGDELLLFHGARVDSVEEMRKKMEIPRPWILVFARYTKAALLSSSAAPSMKQTSYEYQIRLVEGNAIGWRLASIKNAKYMEVMFLEDNGLAERSGVEKHDRVLAINGVAVRDYTKSGDRFLCFAMFEIEHVLLIGTSGCRSFWSC